MNDAYDFLVFPVLASGDRATPIPLNKQPLGLPPPANSLPIQLEYLGVKPRYPLKLASQISHVRLALGLGLGLIQKC